MPRPRGCCTARPARERAAYLTELVDGLRADLASNDLDALGYELDDDAEPDRRAVTMIAPLPEILGGGIPAGTVDLVQHEGRWLVERLAPRRAS